MRTAETVTASDAHEGVCCTRLTRVVLLLTFRGESRAADSKLTERCTTLLRFLFGGLATVAGIVLLFVASFGDPVAVMRWAQTTLPFVAATHSNDVSAPPQQPRPAAEASVVPTAPALPQVQAQVQPQPPIEAQAQPQPQVEAQVQVPPQPQARVPSPPASATDNVSAPPAAEMDMQAQRAALQEELRNLQAETEQAAESVNTLRNQASQERQDLDALQRERAQEQRELDRLHAAQAMAAAVKAEMAQTQQQPPAAAPQTRAAPQAATQTAAIQTPPAPVAAQPAPQSQAQQPQPQPQPAPQMATPAPPVAPALTAEAGNPDLPLPPPVPAAPLPPLRSPVQTAARNPAARAMPPPAGDYARQTDQADNAALQAVIARLRQQRRGEAQTSYADPQRAYADSQQSYAAVQPPYGGYQQPPSPPPQVPLSAPQHAYAQPAPAGPRRRLGLARAALVAGNLEAARQYLEEAQLQLVFRPVTPDNDQPASSSRVASDVASALSMLGSGNSSGALGYVDRAMAEVRPASAEAPQFYGYAGGYGAPQPQ